MSKLPSQQLSNSQQIKPTLAVRAITAPAQRFTSELIKLKPKIESSEEPSTTPASIEKKTDDVSTKSLKKPTVPIRKTSRLQQAEADLDEIPDPPPELKISSAEEQKLRNDGELLRVCLIERKRRPAAKRSFVFFPPNDWHFVAHLVLFSGSGQVCP
jgi:hypothetical protein